MKLIRRYESCIGLSLPSIGRWKLELWFAPSGYQIQPHSHDNVDIWLYLLFGERICFFRRRKNDTNWQEFQGRWYHIGRRFTIRRGVLHYFHVSRFPLIFLNVEKWYSKPTSASEDFNKEI